jgi:hypothetical protein
VRVTGYATGSYLPEGLAGKRNIINCCGGHQVEKNVLEENHLIAN